MTDWQQLISAFVDANIDAPEFERRFLEGWRAAQAEGEQVPFAVDQLFYRVDAYNPDADSRDPYDLDEDQLRTAALVLLGRLDQPWPEPGEFAERDAEILNQIRRTADAQNLLRK